MYRSGGRAGVFSSEFGDCRDRYQKTKDQGKNRTDLKEGHPEETGGDQRAEPFQSTSELL